MYKKPKLELQATTLWDYPSQHYGDGMQGDRHYKGATPSYVIWNLIQRYTREGDLVAPVVREVSAVVSGPDELRGLDLHGLTAARHRAAAASFSRVISPRVQNRSPVGRGGSHCEPRRRRRVAFPQLQG